MAVTPLEPSPPAPIDPELLLLRVGTLQEIHGYLASKVRRARNDLGENQATFARRAGVALRTYKRFEVSGAGSIETLIRVLRAIERADRLKLLFPSPMPKRQPTLEERLAKAQEAWAARGRRGQGQN